MARRSDHTRPELAALALRSAREIVRESGISKLSTRKLAQRIGYTSGTIYQVFRNRDDLVETMNAETLDRLYQHCKSNEQSGSLQNRLRCLAGAFVSFAANHSNEWDAVINYPFSQGHRFSEEYSRRIDQLLGLLSEMISELYDHSEQDRLDRDTRLIWHSMYGVFALASAGRLGEGREIDEAIDDLIEMYVAARS